MILEFSADIPERNANNIKFTFKSLLENKFTNRELLWPWLKAGNLPSIYIVPDEGKDET